jgi:leader peptidase (prepilin peptidase)/N-methyltransferase
MAHDMDPFRLLEIAAAFVTGACVGSFLNVCIYRIPLDRSIIHPGSHCAACGAPIPWYRNIPIVSWLALRGRAACCGTRIDVRYLLIEIVTAALFAALWITFPPIEAVIYAIFVAGILCASMIDLDHYIIPDRFSLGGCVAGFVLCALHPALMGKTTALQGFSWSLASAIIGALVLLAIAAIGTFFFKKEAMGMGDVKFIAAMAAFLGGLSVGWILVVASAVGSVIGLGLIFWQRGAWGTRIPFGPFLGLAAILWLFGGSHLTHAYVHHVYVTWKMLNAPMIDHPVGAP